VEALGAEPHDLDLGRRERSTTVAGRRVALPAHAGVTAPDALPMRQSKRDPRGDIAPVDELAPDVWQLPLLPLQGVNVYLVGDVLVDAGTAWSQRRLLTALEGHPLSAHLLTHAHPDHQGATAALCDARSIPLWCGAADRAAAESAVFTGDWRGRAPFVLRLADRLGGPGHRVDRTLREGDRVAGFVVVETPGHTPGHISLWREGDRVVILGDVASHRNPLSLSRGLREPSRLVTRDPIENRRSIHKIAALRPRLVCFGHGPPLADGERFVRWADALAT
jgi:hydroxyacylglutathione hydrolase